MQERENQQQDNFWGEVISTYTRKQAIEDGVLIDASYLSKEAGIKFPVAITQALWSEYIEPDKTLQQYGQSIDGRLWDLLHMFHHAARNNSGSVLHFEVLFLMETKPAPKTRCVTVKVICGPGDNAKPVITMMKQNED